MTQCSIEEEQASFGWKLVAGLVAFILYEAYLSLWQSVVKPFPDYMYLEFHSVFLNYLALSEHIGNDLPRLISDSSLTAYPHGFFLFPWLVCAMGLQKIFIQNPWLLTLFLSLPLALLPLVMDWGRKTTALYLFFIFVNPASQIILKSWNIQSMIAIYGLIAVSVYLSNLRTPRFYKILIFYAFAILAITLKHLGAFYFLIFFFVLFLWRFLRRESVINELILALMLGNISILFYPSESFVYLTDVIRSHNPYFNGPELLVMIAGSLLLGTFSLAMMRRKMGTKTIPLNLFRSWTLIFIIFLWNAILLSPFNMAQGQIAALAFLLLTLGVSVFFLTNYDLRAEIAILILLFLSTIGWGGALYFARIGHTSSITFFPVILFVFIWVLHSPGLKEAFLMGSLFLLYSNFFPSQNFFTEHLGDRKAFNRLFHTQEQNPLGWSCSGILQAREALIKILESYDYGPEVYEKGLKTIPRGLRLRAFGLKQNYIHHYPEIEDELSEEEIESSYVAIKYAHHFNDFQMLDDLWIKWITGGRFALLIFDEFHHEDEERHLFQHRIKGAIQGIMSRGELEHSEIIQLGDEIGKVIIPYIRSKPFLMENFWQHELSFKGQSYFALVHKSINRRSHPPSGPNYYLTERLN